MKVAYNWLKEFVDVAAPADEIASRLALAGTNVASIENGPHGAVIDAEVTSNRPDCLGMLGIAREVAAIYRLPLKQFSPKPAESVSAKAERRSQRKDRGSGTLRPLHRACHSRRQDPAFACLAEGSPGSCRRCQHQQRRGRHQLRDARTRPSTCTRSTTTCVRDHSIVVRRARARRKNENP